jgi:hypothetical protein
MKISLEDFSENVGGGYIFKQKIGNENIHEIMIVRFE